MDNKFINTKQEIIDFINQYTTLENHDYEIVNENDQLIVNTFKDVVFTEDFRISSYYYFPVKFGMVQGDFDCSYCYNLNYLDGMPYLITKDLLLVGNEFTRFPNYPIKVNNIVDCSECYNITSLKNIPNSKIIRLESCTSLKYLPKNVVELYIENCEFIFNKDLKYLPLTIERIGLPDNIDKIPELPLLKWISFQENTEVSLPSAQYMRQLIKNNIFIELIEDWEELPLCFEIINLFQKNEILEACLLFKQAYNEDYLLENDVFTITESDVNIGM